MIKVEGYRVPGHGPDGKFHFNPRIFTKGQALQHLINCNLLFGAIITELTETKVCMSTQVCAKTDMDTFDGPSDEMAPIVLLCALYAKQVHSQEMPQAAAELAFKRLGDSAGIPLILSMAAGQMIGELGLKGAIASIFGVQDEKELSLLANKDVKDVGALAAMALDGEIDFKKGLVEVL
jgi:hypothetical protein